MANAKNTTQRASNRADAPDIADRLHQNIMLIEAARRVATNDGTPEDAGDPIAAVLDIALKDLRELRDEFMLRGTSAA
jgi:hypothetical protein